MIVHYSYYKIRITWENPLACYHYLLYAKVGIFPKNNAVHIFSFCICYFVANTGFALSKRELENQLKYKQGRLQKGWSYHKYTHTQV